MRRRLWILASTAVICFALFCLTAAVWGSWWRFPNMPTAEEWSALFGMTALVALGFAWYQIKQVDQSNKALIASNEHAQHVNLEAVRPRVQVWLHFDRNVPSQRGGTPTGTVRIAVRNIGVSPAHDVRLTVSPPFTSLETFFKPGMMGQHFELINGVFDGSVAFPTLHPGNKYIWFLGRVPELFEDESGVPRRWHVDATYSGTVTSKPFHDSFILDLDIEKQIELPVDPLIRIGKDIEAVGKGLKAIKGSLPRELALNEESVAALRPSTSRPRLRTPRLRRTRHKSDDG